MSLQEKPSKDLLTIIKDIKEGEKPSEFYINGQCWALTGSRFFENKRDTEWDFFTQHNQPIINWLHQQGFKPIYSASHPYIDIDVKEVYQYIGEDIQVDIQLVNDFQRRLVIRDLLKSTGLPWN